MHRIGGYNYHRPPVAFTKLPETELRQFEHNRCGVVQAGSSRRAGSTPMADSAPKASSVAALIRSAALIGQSNGFPSKLLFILLRLRLNDADHS